LEIEDSRQETSEFTREYKAAGKKRQVADRKAGTGHRKSQKGKPMRRKTTS